MCRSGKSNSPSEDLINSRCVPAVHFAFTPGWLSQFIFASHVLSYPDDEVMPCSRKVSMLEECIVFGTPSALPERTCVCGQWQPMQKSFKLFYKWMMSSMERGETVGFGCVKACDSSPITYYLLLIKLQNGSKVTFKLKTKQGGRHFWASSHSELQKVFDYTYCLQRLCSEILRPIFVRAIFIYFMA